MSREALLVANAQVDNLLLMQAPLYVLCVRLAVHKHPQAKQNASSALKVITVVVQGHQHVPNATRVLFLPISARQCVMFAPQGNLSLPQALVIVPTVWKELTLAIMVLCYARSAYQELSLPVHQP